MERVPTAEELIEKTGSHEFWQNFHLVKEDLKESMIEFAKLHVEAALKAKVDAMIERSYEDSSYSMKELDSFTRDSYPLENIK
jgi:hypothetical protein